MPRFSLVVATLGRTTEIAELLASIADQNRSDIELIVVDQNDDDRIVPLVKTLRNRIAVLHLRLKEKNSQRLGTPASRPVPVRSSLFRTTIAGIRPTC